MDQNTLGTVKMRREDPCLWREPVYGDGLQSTKTLEEQWLRVYRLFAQVGVKVKDGR